jgi:hypothetical protein
MRSNDLPEFAKLLGDFLMGYGKPRPDTDTTAFWFKALAPFSPATIGQAFAAYATERPDFAPVPNSIAARCRLLDGRPDENEAWAIALSSRDERDSVMWTGEIQEAFNLCRPVFDSGDEIGARMAFKDAYARLVQAARINNRPAAWSISEGWDVERRQLVVARAVHAGLIAGPPAHLALGFEGAQQEGRPDGLVRLLDACKSILNPYGNADEVAPQVDERDERLREEAAQKVRDYEARANPNGRKSIYFNPDKA